MAADVRVLITKSHCWMEIQDSKAWAVREATRKVRLEPQMALPLASLSAHRQHCPPTCYGAGPRQERVAQECSRLIAKGLLLHLLPRPLAALLLAGEEGLGSDGLVGSGENITGC